MRMPHEVMTDFSEMEGKDGTEPVSNSCGTTGIRIPLSRTSKSRAGSDSEEESDSGSDDDSTATPEIEKTVGSTFENSITNKFRAMSIGSDALTNSVESNMPEMGNGKPRFRPSSRNSQTSESDEDSDSSDEFGEKARQENYSNLLKLLSRNRSEQDENANNTNETSENDNETCAGDESEDDEYIERGLSGKPYQHGGKPYDRSPTDGDTESQGRQGCTSATFNSEAQSTRIRRSPRDEDQMPNRIFENFYPDVLEHQHVYAHTMIEAAAISTEAQSTCFEWNPRNEEPVMAHAFQSTPDVVLENQHGQIQRDPENQDFPEEMYLSASHELITMSNNVKSFDFDAIETMFGSEFIDTNSLGVIDSNQISPSNHSESPCSQQTGYDNELASSLLSSYGLIDSNHPSPMDPPEIRINDCYDNSNGSSSPGSGCFGTYAESPIESPQSLPYSLEEILEGLSSIKESENRSEMRTCLVPQPLSSSSSTDSSSVQLSTSVYTKQVDPCVEQQIVTQIDGIAIAQAGEQHAPGLPNYQALFCSGVNQTSNLTHHLHPTANVTMIHGNSNIGQFSLDMFFKNQAPIQVEKNPKPMPGKNTLPVYTSGQKQNGEYTESILVHNSIGIVTVNPENQNHVESNSVNLQLNGVLSKPPPNGPVNTNSSRIPKPVEKIDQPTKEESTPKKPMYIGSWGLLHLSDGPALERFQREIGEKKLLRVMNSMYTITYETFTMQDDDTRDTYLMMLLRNLTQKPSYLVQIPPVLGKMKKFRKSLIVRNDRDNDHGPDALYLAAIMCPKYSYVVGVLAAAILKEYDGTSEVWQRSYSKNNDTLIHEIAAKGDTHLEILQELLLVQKTAKCILFDFSAQNCEGKTPLHVAVETHSRTGNGIRMIRLLIESGADPTVREKQYGNTALHMAISSTCPWGTVQALLHNNARDNAINIRNNEGNTPVHLAAAMYNAELNVQMKVCRKLIDFGGQINIRNVFNKIPLQKVAAYVRSTNQREQHYFRCTTPLGYNCSS